MTLAPPSLGVILGDLVWPGLNGDPNGYARCATVAFGFTPRGRRSGPILILIYHNLNLSTQLYLSSSVLHNQFNKLHLWLRIIKATLIMIKVD